MLENVQKGIFVPLFEYSGRVFIIKTQPEKLITEVTNLTISKAVFLIFLEHFVLR